jgi:hypothetical protein
MELWIRSQNKQKLSKVDDIYYVADGDFWAIRTNRSSLNNAGLYATEQRCLEIIDEIQKILQHNGLLVVKDIDISGLTRKDFEPFKPLVYTSESDFNKKGEISFNQLSSYVYEMPQE